MKKAKLSDYYTEEEKTMELSPIWIDEPFYRASDDKVKELELTTLEFRFLYIFANMNNMLFVNHSGSCYCLGVKLTQL